MNKFFKIGTVLALTLAFTSIKAQNSSPVDFMRLNPYQMKSNPATDLPYESVMSIFIGNIGFDLQNTSIRFDNLFEFDAQGRPTTLNLRQFANSLSESNYLGFNLDADLFTLYRRLNSGMITINYGLKVQTDAKYSDGLFKLLGYGNGAFVGDDNPVKINLDMNAQVYQEIAVGYQTNVTDRLSFGGRAKVLFGFANVTTDAFDVQLFTDPDSYALRLRENIAMKASLPSVFYLDDGKLMTNGQFRLGELFRNPGVGFDVAAEYHLSDQFSVVAAVHDLGFIHWGSSNIAMTGKINDAGQYYDDDSFLFSGMDLGQLQQIISDPEYREHYMDTLKQYFQLGFSPLEKYNTMLNTNVLLRGNYDLNDNNRISAQVQGNFLGSGFRPALTFAYCGTFFNNINLCATYSMMSGSYANFGLGVSAMIATCNIYLTTNNVVGCFNPRNISNVNAQVGVVFNLRE